jgi:hypothetical protein
VLLARLEEREGNLSRAIDYLKMSLKTSPNPDVVRQQISELEQKVASSKATNSPAGAGGNTP